MKNYIDINRQAWNARTEHHINSDFYDLTSFKQGRSSLNQIEMEFLSDIAGKSVLHLQCHFGQDSISLARLGAQVTGVDFSEQAIEAANTLAAELDVNAKFVCSDVYDLPGLVDEQFDFVFTSYGTIGWLPDMGRWASLINHFLKPGSDLVFVEFHPVVWMFDNDFNNIAYSYFNTQAIEEVAEGSYASKDSGIVETITWNHSLDEVFDALLANGLAIESFREYDYSPYNCFKHSVELATGKYRIKNLAGIIPMVYSLVAKKKI